MKPPLYITADKRKIKDFPKSRQVGTSFIRKTLPNIVKPDPEYVTKCINKSSTRKINI